MGGSNVCRTATIVATLAFFGVANVIPAIDDVPAVTDKSGEFKVAADMKVPKSQPKPKKKQRYERSN
jgi:hypothetical protein